ncbi:MAG: M3 family metallopeptidase, partial [Alphaproteobacteria bacterium]
MSLHENPLLSDWTTPYELPPFSDIQPEHYRPAFEAAFAAHNAEIAQLAAETAPPSFANTIDALERSGRLLRRVASVFFNLVHADSSPELREVERDIAPRFASHYQAIFTNAALFARVDALYKTRETDDLTGEQRRVLEKHHRHFVRAGVALDEQGRKRMAEISQRQAELGTQFGQNVMADESSYLLLLEEEADLEGLPDFFRAAAAATATERGHDGKYAITLSRSSVEPFLHLSARRDLREKAFKAWISRGSNGGDTDNRAIITELLRLRAERAQLLGFANFADFKLDDTMAKNAPAVRDLLMAVWEPASARAAREREALAEAIRAEGENFDIAPWDWRYYAEKVRKSRYDLDEAETKPYFELNRMIEAAFETARALFGVTFRERTDLPIYHPDVRVWEMLGRDGQVRGLFLGDYFARPSKQSGAWMNNFRDQERLDGEVLPIVVNVLNLVKGAPGEPVLLSLDDARTLFHEFGHGLHGLLSDVTYPSVSGTGVKRDFVELPSQLYEHWLLTPEILSRYAIHTETGEPMPQALVDRLLAARNFNQGHAMVEYLTSAIVDLDLHENARPDADVDVDATEAKTRERLQA